MSRWPGNRYRAATGGRCPGESNINQTDRFCFAPAAGAGDAGHAQRPVGAESLKAAGRHRGGHFLANRAVPREQLFRHAEQIALNAIVVRDCAAEVVIARTGHGGNHLAEHSAGATLGRRDLRPRAAEQIAQHRGHRLAVLAHDKLAQPRLHFVHNPLRHRRRLGSAVRASPRESRPAPPPRSCRRLGYSLAASGRRSLPRHPTRPRRTCGPRGAISRPRLAAGEGQSRSRKSIAFRMARPARRTPAPCRPAPPARPPCRRGYRAHRLRPGPWPVFDWPPPSSAHGGGRTLPASPGTSRRGALTPITSANAWRVRSSSVGPSPPLTITSSAIGARATNGFGDRAAVVADGAVGKRRDPVRRQLARRCAVGVHGLAAGESRRRWKSVPRSCQIHLVEPHPASRTGLHGSRRHLGPAEQRAAVRASRNALRRGTGCFSSSGGWTTRAGISRIFLLASR